MKKKIKHICDWQKSVTEVRVGNAHIRFTFYACPGCGSMSDLCWIPNPDKEPDPMPKLTRLFPKPDGSTIEWLKKPGAGGSQTKKKP